MSFPCLLQGSFLEFTAAGYIRQKEAAVRKTPKAIPGLGGILFSPIVFFSCYKTAILAASDITLNKPTQKLLCLRLPGTAENPLRFHGKRTGYCHPPLLHAGNL